MKALSVKPGILLFVFGLTLWCAAVWGADWKEFTEANTGIFHYDGQSISSTPQGYVRVWIHNVTQHQTSRLEFNCKARSYRVLDVTDYDEAGRLKDRYDYYDNPGWLDISPKSVPEALQKIVCP